jgi:hypothetical protein
LQYKNKTKDIKENEVFEKLKQLGGNPKKFTENELPYIKTKSGHLIPIRKAKTIPDKSVPITIIAKNSVKERYVTLGNNHHIEIFEVLTKTETLKNSTGDVLVYLNQCNVCGKSNRSLLARIIMATEHQHG